MTVISPTVTATDIESFNAQCRLVCSFADRIHIDLMDGEFAPTQSPEISELVLQTDKTIDIHLMYKNPSLVINQLIELKPNLVIVHAETDTDIPFFAATLRAQGIKTGIALLPDTTPESVNYILPHVQHALVFGGHLGYHGGHADLTQLEKVAMLKKLHPYLEIGWDGGANLENIEQIARAGIDVINVGGAIHKSDSPETTYATMKATLASV